MPDKLSHIEVYNKYLEFDLQLLEPYINSASWHNTKCKCGKEFKSKPYTIFSGNTKSCGHCDDPKVGDRFGKLTITNIFPARHKGCKVICICDCGQSFGPIKYGALSKSYIHGTIITCGKCAYMEIGKKYGSLTILKIIKYGTGGGSVQAICDCGNILNLKLAVIKNGNTKSCGHCNDPKIGDIFGDLTVIAVKPNNGIGCKIQCKCSCDKITPFYTSSRFKSGNNRSCGNCKLLRNGLLTSYTALELHDLVEKVLGNRCIHNKKIGKYCVDIVSEQHKIAIEYDGYYYHRVYHDTTKQEPKKDKLLICKGYKLLRIRSNGNDIPTEEQLCKVLLNDFQHGCKKKTITMQSWRYASKRYNTKE